MAARADDRTTKARVRDAAIACFAELGVRGTTARKVAAAAGVSPGLVMHHFGSMDGLRRACDEHVTAVIREQKLRAVAQGPELDVLAALRESDHEHLGAYLARVLTDDSPAVTALVDDLVRDAEAYLEEGVRTGMVTPTEDPHGRAVVLTMWSLGLLVLHHHVARHLGVDPSDPELGRAPERLAAYALPATELLAGGLLTETFAARALDAFRHPASPAGTTPTKGARS